MSEVGNLIDSAAIYAEYVGGLGDAILRMYFSGQSWYGRLETLTEREHAVVTLMSHSPYLKEVFLWHPKRKRIHVLDLGFTTTFHPWENREWRVEHDLPPEAPCPPYTPSDTLTFYPSPSDRGMLRRIRKSPSRYIVLAAVAGKPEKSIPPVLREEIAWVTTMFGFRIVVVGRSSYFRPEDLSWSRKPSRKDFVDAVDRLTVPGMMRLVKGAAGIVSADTSVLHAAWQEHKPVFLLYNRWTAENLVPRGPVGYMQGIDRGETDHMEFSNYTNDRLRRWLSNRVEV
jgi:hypothetical protein